MAPRVIRHRSFWAFTTLALLCLAGVCAGVGVIVRDRLAPPEAALLRAILQRHTGEFITLAAVVLVAVALGVDWVFRLYILPIARLSEEVAILFESAPERRLRLHGSREVMRLAESINRAAERVARLQLSLDERIRASASQARAESGVLSVVIAELDEGVVICNPDGVISLYNERARVLLGAGDPPQSSSTPERFGCYVGLGRSLLGLLDKGVVGHLFEDIVDQLRRGRAAARASALVTGCTGRFLRLEAAPILGMRREITGYVLVFSDITRQLEALDRAKMGMERLAAEARASADIIRRAWVGATAGTGGRAGTGAAARLRGAIERLLHAVEGAAEESARIHPAGLPLARVRLADLAADVQRRALAGLGLPLAVRVPDTLCVRLDGYSFGLALMALLERLRDHGCGRGLHLCAIPSDGSIRLDIRWQGNGVADGVLREWAGRPGVPADVLTRFRIAVAPLARDEGGPGLRLVLAAAEGAGAPPVPPVARATLLPANRPVFYDFDLFHDRRAGRDRRLLAESAYTVFDTETTGLDPGGGDEIIAIGAVRIVNGRLLQQEVFEQLVDPRRPVPEGSVRVHGIPPTALVQQPGIERVLPLFQRYAEGTVLVAHNAAFDLRMLAEAEKRTGTRFDQPVLDTMLLSAVVHPAQESHSLEAVAARLGVTIIGRHTALGDAVATAEIFLKLLPLLAAEGLTTLEQALEASRRTAAARLRY